MKVYYNPTNESTLGELSTFELYGDDENTAIMPNLPYPSSDLADYAYIAYRIKQYVAKYFISNFPPSAS